jgi:hypothetical protein
MSPPATPDFVAGLARDLQGYLALCREAYALAARENQLLAAPEEYPPFEFYQGRKALLSRLDEALNSLRASRQAWQRLDAVQRAHCLEVKRLLQQVQDALVRILVLDRENQQALLRRGLVPARQMSSFASQPAHWAARTYLRHSS